MADLGAPRPEEPEKLGAFLHDRTTRPAVRLPGGRELLRRHLGLVLGIACALALTALAFQARASWNSHRDWVVPMTAPLLAAGGIAAGHLAARREWNDLTPALFLGAILVLVIGGDVWLDIDEPEDAGGLRDAVSIAAGVLIGCTVVAALAAFARVEWTRPTKVPPPAA